MWPAVAAQQGRPVHKALQASREALCAVAQEAAVVVVPLLDFLVAPAGKGASLVAVVEAAAPAGSRQRELVAVAWAEPAAVVWFGFIHGGDMENVIPIKAEQYVPPSLEFSGSVSIAPLKDKHKGQVCYIIGKGPSLQHLKAHHFGPGPVLVLNESIRYVQTLGLPNQIYSMQKDGCMTEDPHNIPRPCGTCAEHNWQRKPVTNPFPGIAVLFSQHLSSWCLHGRPNRYVFTDAELGFEGFPMTMSTLEAIPLARHFGAASLVMMCFDSIVNGDLGTLAAVDDHQFAMDYEGHEITADIEELHRNLQWVKPYVLQALSRVPHSFFTPRGD